jgi:ubiquinone biosynthesis accessory factor UbiK
MAVSSKYEKYEVTGLGGLKSAPLVSRVCACTYAAVWAVLSYTSTIVPIRDNLLEFAASRLGVVPVDVRTIDELARKLANSLPDGLVALKTDAEQNFKAVLQSTLERMNLVSRQEFDVQTAVLARTREKLTALEQRLAQLEKNAH